MADSNTLRFIDDINHLYDADERAADIQRKIRMLQKQETTRVNRKEIRRLYSELDEVQFKPDYMCLIIDKIEHYDKACKDGFYINGIHYERLLGTNGGVKNSTIVFVSSRVAPELKRRLENGRDLSKPLVPAKFESYKALSCSGSTPVSLPHGICVVPDCVTHFKSNVIYIDDEGVDEPKMEYRENEDVELIDSDGYGLMLPSLAERWSQELGLDYIMSGANTRFSWEKGMVFCFDFLEFADKVAGTRIIKDAWGNEVDLSNIELILTTSQLKLWDSYKSFDDYLDNCLKNGYTFGIPKVCPKELENERYLNYQFIQSFKLTDEQIEELIQPTIKEIKDILGIGHIFDIPASSGNQIIYTIPDSLHTTEGNAMIFISKIIIIDHHWLLDCPKWWKLIRLHLRCIQDHTCHIFLIGLTHYALHVFFFCGRSISHTDDTAHSSGFLFEYRQTVRAYIQFKILEESESIINKQYLDDIFIF